MVERQREIGTGVGSEVNAGAPCAGGGAWRGIRYRVACQARASKRGAGLGGGMRACLCIGVGFLLIDEVEMGMLSPESNRRRKRVTVASCTLPFLTPPELETSLCWMYAALP